MRSLIKLRDDRGFQPSGPAKGPLLLPWAYKPPKFGVILPTVFLKILKAPTRSALKISPVAGHLKSPLTNLAPLWGFPQTGHVCEVKTSSLFIPKDMIIFPIGIEFNRKI